MTEESVIMVPALQQTGQEQTMPSAPLRGRGAAENPANRFESIHYVPDPEDDETHPDTRLYRDTSRTILARNQSPDVGFEFSVNPYRGCEHGCSYCYARPYHEYLGLSAGLDFETRILVKEDAPQLLRQELLSPKWEPQTIAISGVTDAYQPAERRLGITRACLEVLVEFANPAAVVTKNYLVTRDADLLSELAEKDAASGESFHHDPGPQASEVDGASGLHPVGTVGGRSRTLRAGNSGPGNGGSRHPRPHRT